MFVAVATRTMANARPKAQVNDDGWKPVDLAQVRRERRLLALSRAMQEQQRRETAIALAKAAADEAIRKGNAALRRDSGVKFARISARICRATGVSKADIHSHRRSRHVAFARQAIMYWTARLTRLSLPQIGKYLDKDHTTVLHGKQVYVEKRAKMGRTLRVVR